MNSDLPGARRVLLVEDDSFGATLLQKTLQHLGYAVAGVAATAADAVALTACVRPDVVLMDVRLRGPETGVTAARHIHEQSDVPVIYLTAYSDDELLAEACVTEPYAYLVKPVRDRELRAAIETSLYRVAMDRRLRHFNQVLSAIRDVSQLICRATEATALLQESCSVLLRTRSYRAVWIGLCREGSANRPTWVAAAGTGLDLLRGMAATADASSRPSHRACQGGRSVTADAGGSDAAERAARDQLMALDIGPELATPIHHGSRCLGVLCIHANRGFRFDAEEISLLEGAAADLGLGLCNLEARARLRDSEERYRGLFENDHTVILLLDPATGAIVDANPAAVRFYGATREELRQKDLAQISAMTAAEVAAALARAPENPLLELKQRRADGSVRNVEVSAGPMEVGGRELLYMIAQDITERRQAEAELACQVEELRRWYTVTLGRELRIAELKREVNALAARLSLALPYGAPDVGEPGGALSSPPPR